MLVGQPPRESDVNRKQTFVSVFGSVQNIVMTYDEVMNNLRAAGEEKIRRQNAARGAGDNQFGVQMGHLRAMAKQIKANPELAAELWGSGNVDAMQLATLLMKPNLLSVEDLERMMEPVTYSWLADWLGTNVIKVHKEKDTVREKWMDSAHPTVARMGWSLTTERVSKNPDGLDLSGLLDRIEREMGSAPELSQWSMNHCLAEIGIKFPEYRARALAIGEKIGAFRDYPVSKGCTSPYAPIWIAAMVQRNG